MRLRAIFCAILFLLAMELQGCTASFRDYGRFSPDLKVAKTLEQYQVDPGMNYYVSGSDLYPNALLGLKKNYILESDLWKRVEMTPQRMKEIVTDMKEKASMIRQNLFGFTLLDPSGKPVGIWYSLLSATTFLKFKEDNHIVVYTPDLDTYNKYEDNRGGIGVGR